MPRFFYGHVIVIVGLLVTTLVYGVYTTFGVFFVPMLTEFGWTRTMTSGAYSLSWIVHGLLGIVMGRFNDRFGPRLVITVCGLLLGSGYLLMSQVNSLWQFYIFYGVVIGTGMSGPYITLTSTVARWFIKRRGMMTGIMLTGIGIGNLVAPRVADWLISAHDWRTSYIILGALLLVVVVLAAQLLKRDPSKVGQIPYGRSQEERVFESNATDFSLSNAVQARQFWLTCGILFSFGLCVWAFMVHIVAHVTELGLSATTGANVLACIGGMTIVGKVILGIAADRIGNRQVLILGFILLSASSFWLVPATEVWMLYLFAVVFGFAYGGCAASMSPLVATLFGLTSHGLILAVVDLGFTMGAGAGPILAAYLFDITGDYQAAFLACGSIIAVALILTIALRSKDRSIIKPNS